MPLADQKTIGDTRLRHDPIYYESSDIHMSQSRSRDITQAQAFSSLATASHNHRYRAVDPLKRFVWYH